MYSMKKFSSKFEPSGDANKPWKTVYFNNSDYAGDPISIRSISNFIPYVLGVD